jgi:predicted MPP superfamily phosphohydrolase
VIEAKDFSKLKRFPGQTGNPFDILIHRATDLEHIPKLLFALLLAALSLLGYYVNGLNSLFIILFFLFDWISVSLLPRYKRSFGPKKPQVLLLAFFRMIPVVFFGPVVWIPLEILGCVLQIYAFWVEPYAIRINQQILETGKIPTGNHFKILHLGDLHLERHSIREDRLNALIKELAPDAILFSGDYLCLSSIRDHNAWTDLKQVLQDWQAPQGVYGVTGSPAVDLPENFPGLLEGTPVQLLADRTVTLIKNGASIQVIGLECTHMPHAEYPRLQSLLAECKPGFRILLHHSPDLAPQIQDLDIDLHLAGHTHGGQVCLPFIGPVFTGSLYGLTFKSGRYQLKNLTLFITRGLGLEGLSAPRVRFLCPPEVVMWDIIGKG